MKINNINRKSIVNFLQYSPLKIYRRFLKLRKSGKLKVLKSNFIKQKTKKINVEKSISINTKLLLARIKKTFKTSRYKFSETVARVAFRKIRSFLKRRKTVENKKKRALQLKKNT